MICNGGSKVGSKQLRNNGLYEHKRKQNWILKYISFTVLVLSECKTIPNKAAYSYFVVKVAFCKQNIWNPNPDEVSFLTSIAHIHT